jgi:hypothetical protein
MRSQFGLANREEWKDRITRENWSGLSPSGYTTHLATCGDCQTSLFQFLDVREFLDYRSHLCFHVAYYSADIPDRCIERSQGVYSILINREKRESIVIGFCPWCGMDLLTGISIEPLSGQ